MEPAMSADHSASSGQNRGLQVGDLLTITDAVPVDITVLAADGRGVTCEPVCSQSSWTSADAAKDKGYLRQTCHPDDLVRILDERSGKLTNEVPFELEMRLLTKSENIVGIWPGTIP